MAIKKIQIQNFSGGISLGEKVGVENSTKFLKNMNIFESPDYMTQSMKATKKSSTTVDGLIHWMQDASPWNTNRYAFDANSVIYKITSSDTFSKIKTDLGDVGKGLLVHDDYLYYAYFDEIGRYGKLSGTPTFNDDFTDWWLASDVEDTGGGTGAADYVPPTSISETATNRQTWTASHDPLDWILIDVDVKGTGDWTVTVHDSNNREIATDTITNAVLNIGDNVFGLGGARIEPGEQYHFHVTSTVADGGVDTETATDLEGAYFEVRYKTIIGDADFNPMSEMLGGWAVGNDRYIGFFDNINGEYNPTRVVLAPGFQVRSLYRTSEYLIAEAWRGQSFAEAEEGRRYYWDGIETTYNFFEDLPMGGSNAAAPYRNNLVGVYGNQGGIYTGGEEFQKVIDNIPKITRGKKIEVYPGAIDEYDEKLVIGYCAVTDDGTNFEQGVYQFGSQTDAQANVLSFPYTISTGTTSATTLKIGCVKSFGQDLYIGWRDDATYGVDKIALGDGAVDGGTWESRIFDDGDADKYKQAIKMEITFETLTTNQTVTPKYKLNRGAWVTGTAATSGATEIELYINTIFKEIEVGFDIASSSNTFVKITSVSFAYEPQSQEDEDA